MTIEEVCAGITSTDQQAMEGARIHWDSIAHPLHSLGKLEDVIVQIAGIQKTPQIAIKKKALVVMCADNGVVAEGVTQSGQEVTAIVSENFLNEKATASILCRQTGADIVPIDIGMAADTRVRSCKVAYGTKNMAKDPAMSREEAIQAIMTGVQIVGELHQQGYRVLATGEMGIGNTTTSSAIAAVLLNQSVEAVTGRGAGLSSQGLQRKISVIQQAIQLHQPDPADAVDVIAKVGGFDIAGMAGVFLGGAYYHMPVVIDGFISCVAALCASRICPEAAQYMIASHVSREPAAVMLLQAMDKQAFLTCDMCLGEGSGAVTLFPLLDMAAAVYHSMSTFDDNSMEHYQPLV
ncbi:MAG: nicotinate-nucleotide--dimethylbenzimidazole phosphoribosyltransferase [Lachnospiraceae bacterium]|nr:nicotinate-nucleotide--dimethylbenzimidazole phosphoribosyltransferase [Lachnospiraceae bacterium]